MSKKIYAVLIAACVVLGGICGFLLVSEDDVAPRFSFPQEKITYTEGQNFEELLKGVEAQDNKDGNVTDYIMIEKITPEQNGTTAVVVYVVKDKSNNVTKVSRKVNYVAGGDNQASDDKEEVTPTPTPTPEPTATPTPTPTPTVDPFEGLAADAPRITLKEERITVEVGASVNRIALVDRIEDDEDSNDYLWAHIHIEGDRLNTSRAGEYQMVYYVVDSDGNRSNDAEITIVVE